VSEAVQTAEALRAAGRHLGRALVEFEEARVEADPFEDLRRAAQNGARVVGRQLLTPDPAWVQEIDAASVRFATQAADLVDAYRNGALPVEQLPIEMRAAFIRQARKTFRAGKRSLGSLAPLTLEDEADIADAVDRQGLTPGLPVGKRTLGALVTRIAAIPPLTPEQKAVVKQIDRAMALYAETLVKNVMLAGYTDVADDKLTAAIAKQTEIARRRIERQLTDGRRRILSGTLSAEAAVAILAAALAVEAARAFERARKDRPLEPLESDRLEAAQRATEDAVRRETGNRFGIGALLLLALIVPPALNADARKWLMDRLRAVPFWGFGQAGQKAAFRAGTPAPPADSTGRLSGVGFPRRVGALEERVVVWWHLEPQAEHCIDCIRLSDMSPFYLDVLSRLGMYPGSHHTRCGSNCLCHLIFEAPRFAVA
jgi:hypothetical protein